jgi:SAM-dependent methyltransferase
VGRFASTVDLYARYREPYPPEFFAAVAKRLQLSGTERLLDVGCGPGLLAIGFAPYVRSCIGVDPEPGMVAAAEQAARDASVELTVLRSRFEDLPSNTGQFDIVTIGRALHWLDHDAALATLDRIVFLNGFVLVCGAPVSDSPRNAWLQHYKAVRHAYSAEKNETRFRIDFNNWFAPSRFRQIDRVAVSTSQTVRVSDLVRRALSMSTTSPEVVGARRPAFEAEMQAALAPFAVNGFITEEIEAQATIFG